jgi:alkaline phosphatase D
MLWLGDTVYLRDQEVDSPSAIRYRYRFSRGAPELQRFLGATSHYAIWDDHDFGPDDSDGSYPLKHVTTDLFKRYWPAIHHGLPDVPGVFQTFVLSDIRVFLLDDRTYRVPDNTPDGPAKTFLGKGQKDWFKEALLSSTETFKIVAIGTQAFSEKNQKNESLRLYASELKELLAGPGGRPAPHRARQAHAARPVSAVRVHELAPHVGGPGHQAR